MSAGGAGALPRMRPARAAWRMEAAMLFVSIAKKSWSNLFVGISTFIPETSGIFLWLPQETKNNGSKKINNIFFIRQRKGKKNEGIVN